MPRTMTRVVVALAFESSNPMTILNPDTLTSDPETGLSYRLMQPLPRLVRRCLVLLHGVGSNELSVAGLAQGVSEDTLVALVQGPFALGPQQFAWFQVAFTANGPRIEPQQAERSRQALIQLLAQLQRQYGVLPNQTMVAGFSQGGIMSAGVALTSPESVAGFGLLSGRILPEIEPFLAREDQLVNLQAFVGHGEYDSKLPVDWAYCSHNWLEKLGVRHTLNLYPIDHSISQQMHEDFLRWWATLD